MEDVTITGMYVLLLLAIMYVIVCLMYRDNVSMLNITTIYVICFLSSMLYYV